MNKILFDKIYAKINPNIPPQIKELIALSKGVLAGGSISSIYYDVKINDYDFYIDAQYAEEAFQFLLKIGLEPQMWSTFGCYDGCSRSCQNEMCWNKSVLLNFFGDNNPIIGRLGGTLPYVGKIDFIVLDCDPKKYVENNFDISCCQIWYDGIKCGGVHPDLFLDKKFIFNGPLKENTAERKKKYKEKGFEEISALTCPISSTTIISPQKNRGNFYLWKDDEIFYPYNVDVVVKMPFKILSIYDKD